ncbi:MAG: ABC transporter substrate-binding protein [Thiolinea sp.]
MESYQWQTPNEWIFTLKKGIYFHQGQELTTQDVAASIQRGQRPENKYTHSNLEGISLSVIDKYQFHLKTPSPNSELLWNLSGLYIINHTDINKKEDDFNQTEQLNGTGPYRLLSHQQFNEFHFAAFNQYHRGPPYLQQVVVKINLDEEERVKHFLSGQADLISDISSGQIEKLLPKANIVNQTGHYLYLMAPDVYRDQSPDIRDSHGQIMNSNPLKDVRVRKAISLALDRDALIRQTYGPHSGAQAAGQLVNDNILTASRHLHPDQQDLEQARQLLSEAGYPDGFQLTLTDKDARKPILQLIAGMLRQIGIAAEVQTHPPEIYFDALFKHAYSAGCFMHSKDGNLSRMLTSLLMKDEVSNSGRYFSEALEQQIKKALTRTEPTLKTRYLREASEMAMRDLGIIPMFFVPEIWAIRQDMEFKPSDTFYTEAYYVDKLKK